jgi:hypothetical protein
MTEPILVRLESGGCSLCDAPRKGGATPPVFPKATDAQNKAFIEKIGGLLPRARHWVELAQLKIDMADEFVRRRPVKPQDPFPSLHDIGKPELTLFDKYFHSDKHPHATRSHLQKVRRIYDSMQIVLTESLLQAPMFGWGVGYFQPDPADGTLASQVCRLHVLWRLAPPTSRRHAAPFRRRQLRGRR